MVMALPISQPCSRLAELVVWNKIKEETLSPPLCIQSLRYWFFPALPFTNNIIPRLTQPTSCSDASRNLQVSPCYETDIVENQFHSAQASGVKVPGKLRRVANSKPDADWSQLWECFSCRNKQRAILCHFDNQAQSAVRAVCVWRKK